MKRFITRVIVTTFVASCVLLAPVRATYSLIGSPASCGATGGNTCTTSTTVDTTTANIIFCAAGVYQGVQVLVAGDLTDTAGNSYNLTAITQAGGDGTLRVGIFYKVAPTGNAANSWTLTSGTVSLVALICHAFSQGSSPTFGTSLGNGTTGGGGTTIAAGSIGNANDLVYEALAYYTNTGPTIDGSFSTVTEVAYLAANHIGLEAAWKEVSGAVNPTWTSSGSNTSAARAASVTGVGSGGATPKKTTSLLLGVGH